MEKETTYRSLFDSFAKPGEKFDQEWIDNFDEIIIRGRRSSSVRTRGTVVTRGQVRIFILIYRFKGLFFTSDDFGIDGPYEGFNEAAEAVNLLTVTPTTEEIWIDESVKSDCETNDDDDDDVQRILVN